jgi:hypothetical protein
MAPGSSFHRHAGDRLGYRQLLDGGFLAVAVADHLAFRLLQLELEGRQLVTREQHVGDVVLERELIGRRHGKPGQARRRGG